MMKFDRADKTEHAELIEACRINDRQAQERLYDLYCSAMYNASLRIVNNTAEAEDVMQESFTEAFEKIRFFKGEGSFGSWIKRIVINKSINHLRSKKPTNSIDSDQFEIPDDSESEKTYSENVFCRLEEIRNALKKLPENYRIIISLNLLEGYDHEEIAGILETTYGNVRTRFSRAKQKLLKIIITASVQASNIDKAHKLLDKISIEIEGNRNGVSVETDFNDRIFSGDKKGLSIDIEIMMPESVRLDIDHQFGNAYIDKAQGESDINIQYGSVEIKALTFDVNKIDVSFGEAKINFVSRGDLEISYSSITIDEALELSIDSDYSTVSVSKAEVLEIENEGGNVTIGEVRSIELASKFSEFKIEMLHELMIADTEYGSLKVREIAANFSEINVENSFGAVVLEFMKGSSFNVEADMEFCDLDFPGDAASFSQRIVESTEKYYKGTFGDGPAKSTVQIESSFGNVSIEM